jgi:hypothetical protein
MEVPDSIFNLPVIISQKNLETFINEKIPVDLYEKEDDGDGLIINGKRIGELEVKMVDNEIRYRIQIELNIEKKTLLGSFKASGLIELDLKTSFLITASWSISSSTVLAFYEWMEKPSIKTGLGEVGVKRIANLFLEKNESKICESIDKAITEQVDFKKIISPVWDKMNEKISLPKPLNANFFLHPKSISLSPFKGDQNQIFTLSCIKANPILDFSSGSKADFVPLPSFSPCGNENKGFQIYIPVSISYEMATRLATENLRGQKFEVSGRDIFLETIEVSKSDSKLEIALGLSGFIAGLAVVKFIPNLMEERFEINLEEVEFSLKTKNLFAKGASWLLKNTIIESIKSNANSAVQQGILYAKEALAKELRSIDLQDKGKLDTEIDDIRIEGIQMDETGLSLLVFIGGNGQLGVIL